MRRVYTSGDLDKDTLEAEFWTDDDPLAAIVHEEAGQWVVTSTVAPWTLASLRQE